ncbi:MAG: radical SAM protein [Candidatus Tectomicrobia bacterium]|uniref:Radical SAM protein n=1 Tax=Tectimicrobiota bacterium TaxID=2528274 RepID=A0A933GM90_UNCTE|nr:radical SAM protein [Candidatus Tectomicrobia bacterium]
MKPQTQKMPGSMTIDHLRMASIEITQCCNGQCPYCNQTKGDRNMAVSEFGRLLDHLVDEKIEAVAFGGGEPTLHPALAELLRASKDRGLQTGLTTNCRAPHLVKELAAVNLLDSFGVSAGKGEWLELVQHHRATVNLLLISGGLKTVLDQAVQAVRYGARCLLLLGYKGGQQTPYFPTTSEVVDAYSLLTMLGRKAGIAVAADDYTRRRLRLAETCGEGFVRINIDGTRDVCCFTHCEFRPKTLPANFYSALENP